MIWFALSACLADIRPDTVSTEPDHDAEQSGRVLLASAAAAHGGLDTWRSKHSAEMVFTDVWQGPAKMFSPWPDAEVRARILQHPGTFDSQAEFLQGSKTDWTWGITDGQTYTLDPQGARVDVDDGDIRFMLPTVQYFVDLPFRIVEAELVRSVGTQQVAGSEYTVVYATWGTIDKNREFDQYLVFIDPDTERIAKVEYTVREMAGFITGTAHLDDQRHIDGLWVAHRMTVTTSPDDALDTHSHVMEIEALRYDSLVEDSWDLAEGLSPLH